MKLDDITRRGIADSAKRTLIGRVARRRSCASIDEVIEIVLRETESRLPTIVCGAAFEQMREEAISTLDLHLE